MSQHDDIEDLKKSLSSLAEQNKVVLTQLGKLTKTQGEKASERFAELMKQAEKLKEELSPKVKAFAENAKPTVEKGLEVSKEAAETVKTKFTDDILPAAASAVGTAFALIEVAKSKLATPAPEPVVVEKPTSKTSGLKWLLAGAGVATALGLGFATYRAISAADDHWIGIEDEFTEA